jgi:CheY-like chemotaxis protein
MCVLLVEDEAVILMDLAEALQRAGHEVHTAMDGRQALQALKRLPGRFSALVTDHQMPGGITGSYLAARMRNLYPDVPVIIATGTPDDITEDFKVRYRVKVLPKPYHPALIVQELPAPRR